MTDTCQWNRCRHPISVVFAGIGLCWKHWCKVADAEGSIAENLKNKISARNYAEMLKNLRPPSEDEDLGVIDTPASCGLVASEDSTGEVYTIDLRKLKKPLSMLGIS